ncbi:M24 family metallopeptidase [Pelosinus sp. Bkl1]|uniref:M24 family metallopeptidase n=2 Tax=Pelosinus baikalensis TaxID=2892015 RepID=A0ABS8HX37_9FIRM|nr:M24 family metallopeptidase [Pelosinus baikalensis]MCC5467720.1 M24 family metallopeptidase [Pelosinus baikalensis]
MFWLFTNRIVFAYGQDIVIFWHWRQLLIELAARVNMENRLIKLRKFMNEHKLECMLIQKPENRHYFSGFSGSAGILLISNHSNLLLTDFRYIEQATMQATQYEIVRYHTVGKTLAEMINKLGVFQIGFESDFVTYDGHQELINNLHSVNLVPVQLDALRMVKDENEIASIKKAVEIADNAFSRIVSFIKPGMTEQEVALELEYYMRKFGAEKPAFDTIMASGRRGALPHGRASEKIIELGDFVTMDFGAVYQGYHSDITRTICMGKATAKQKEIYEIVLAAQLAGVQAVAPGKIGKDVDTVSRNIIIDAGFGEFFGHGLGHGLGLNIHEEPRLSPANIHTVLLRNMVVTVEPGIYLPDWGGVRIEDTVLVSDEGCQILTASSKQLIELY